LVFISHFLPARPLKVIPLSPYNWDNKNLICIFKNVLFSQLSHKTSTRPTRQCEFINRLTKTLKKLHIKKVWENISFWGIFDPWSYAGPLCLPQGPLINYETSFGVPKWYTNNFYYKKLKVNCLKIQLLTIPRVCLIVGATCLCLRNVNKHKNWKINNILTP
jgi:hypothetical protein